MAWRRGQAYRQDLRDRVLACSDLPVTQVAMRFGVAHLTFRRCGLAYAISARRYREPSKTTCLLRLTPFTGALRAQIDAQPDAELRELQSWLESTHGLHVSHPVLWKVIARMGLTCKKRTSGQRSRIAKA